MNGVAHYLDLSLKLKLQKPQPVIKNHRPSLLCDPVMTMLENIDVYFTKDVYLISEVLKKISEKECEDFSMLKVGKTLPKNMILDFPNTIYLIINGKAVYTKRLIVVRNHEKWKIATAKELGKELSRRENIF